MKAMVFPLSAIAGGDVASAVSNASSGYDSPAMSRHEYTDDSRGPRLQKVLAEAGIGSRRACEELIEAGEVTVNGTLIDSLPAWVDPENDHIRVHGRKLKLPLVHVYVMLFKPKGTVSTSAEDEERRRLVDLVNHPSGARLYPVGRLDLDTSGLILMTNDGALANKLTHPRHGVSKVYEVTVAGQLDDVQVKRLERGVFLYDRNREKGARTQRSKLSIIKRARDRTLLRMELHEGRNRQIRRMMLAVGHPVKKLRRVQLGPLKLTGLQPGQWRDLLPQELSALRRAAERSGARKKAGRKKTTRAATAGPTDRRSASAPRRSAGRPRRPR
jgi:pseudouridine synthase